MVKHSVLKEKAPLRLQANILRVLHLRVRRIRQVLKQTGGNKTKAADIPQVSYKPLLTKIRDYQLEDKGENESARGWMRR